MSKLVQCFSFFPSSLTIWEKKLLDIRQKYWLNDKKKISDFTASLCAFYRIRHSVVLDSPLSDSAQCHRCSVTQSWLTLQPRALQPVRLLCPWDSPGKNIGVGCHFLLQAILPTEGLNLGLLHCRQILYPEPIYLLPTFGHLTFWGSLLVEWDTDLFLWLYGGCRIEMWK